MSGLCRSPFLIGPLASASRQAIIDDFKAAIWAAAELGAPMLTVVAGGVMPGSRGVDASLAAVASILEAALGEAEAAGIKLALEPLHPVFAGTRSCLVTMRDAAEICAMIPHPALAVAVDVYHVWWDRTLGEQLRKIGGSRIASYHICDWLPESSDILLDRGMMGDGVADLKSIWRSLEKIGYAGPCEVEIFSIRNWWQRPPAEVLDTCVERFHRFC